MKRYLMVGAPVTGVRTPPLLRAHLAERGVAAEIAVRHLEAGELGAFMAEAAADPALDGLLVTMPHKKRVLAHLDSLTEVAAAAGSVNCVKRLEAGALAGAQFDGVALLRALRAAGVVLEGARVLLLGVGGAGRAIAQAIAAEGCAHLALADRDADLLDAVVRTLRGGTRCPVEAAARLDDGEHDLLINATPLGMAAGDPSPFPRALVERAARVADIVADPARTALQVLAEESGVPLVTGRDMVRGQIAPIADWLLSPDPAQ